MTTDEDVYSKEEGSKIITRVSITWTNDDSNDLAANDNGRPQWVGMVRALKPRMVILKDALKAVNEMVEELESSERRLYMLCSTPAHSLHG
jgi:hypothetical protein